MSVLKIKLCLVENVVFGKVLHQDNKSQWSRLSNNWGTIHNQYSHAPILYVSELYLNGSAGKCSDREMFCWSYESKKEAQEAFNGLKDLIQKINQKFEPEEKTTASFEMKSEIIG